MRATARRNTRDYIVKRTARKADGGGVLVHQSHTIAKLSPVRAAIGDAVSALENTLQEMKAVQTGARPTPLPMWEFATFLFAVVVVGGILWAEIAAHAR